MNEEKLQPQKLAQHPKLDSKPELNKNSILVSV